MPPLVILWVGERPLAVRLRSVVAVSRFATHPRVANLVEGEASAMGFASSGCRGRPLAALLAAAAAAAGRALTRAADPHVQVVVVVGERDHHAGGPVRPRVRPDEVLAARAARNRSTRSWDSRGRSGRRRAGPLAAVRARVVDVHVQAVLVAGVADVAELRSKSRRAGG